jgi:hypothetical protein
MVIFWPRFLRDLMKPSMFRALICPYPLPRMAAGTGTTTLSLEFQFADLLRVLVQGLRVALAAAKYQRHADGKDQRENSSHGSAPFLDEWKDTSMAKNREQH